MSAGSRAPIAFSACACSVRINAAARENAPGSARIALWPTPTSAMFCAPVSLHEVCGATIESCQDQIDDTVKDAVLRARALTPKGESAEECDNCGEPIPEKRRQALAGVRTCIACQAERDQQVVHSTINRRGSKDSQLR